MVHLKSEREIARMRDAGRIVAEVLLELAGIVRPGISTGDLDRAAVRAIKQRNGESSFLHYRGYPAHLCTSVNDNIVHGIPRDDEVLVDGDIISIDCGVSYSGYHGDAAVTLPVGAISHEARRLMRITETALLNAILQARPGKRLHDISWAVQSYAEEHSLNVIRDYTGHGIGAKLHEEPSIPNVGRAGTGLRLETGMVVALEPMVTLGTWKTKVDPNKWTVSTTDGSLAAHFEHTVAVTDDGPLVLTAL